MNKKNFVYSGSENLEAMTEAVNYNRFLIELITDRLTGKKVLDFGAGSGTYAKMLKEKGIVPDCLEPDSKLRGTLKEAGFNALESTKDLKPNSYDMIYALNVFEHIEDDFAEIETLKNALKKGGKLLIYVPAYQVLYSSMDKQVGHFRRYKTSRLSSMAMSAGLSIKTLYYYDPIGFAAALVYRFVGGNGTLSPSSVRTYDKFAFPISKVFHPLSRKLVGKNAFLVAEK